VPRYEFYSPARHRRRLATHHSPLTTTRHRRRLTYSPPTPTPQQAVQIFDSWAAQLAPRDFDVFSGPYLTYIIKEAKKQCPDLPIILYISNSGALIERMAKCDPDVISLCHTVDFSEGVKRAGGDKFAYQGNMDAGVLFGDKEHITKRVLETIKTAEDEGVRYDFGFDVCFLRSPAH